MQKSDERLIVLKKTKFEDELIVGEDDLEWEVLPHENYKMVVKLHHTPSGERIEIASNRGEEDSKRRCLRELQFRLCSNQTQKRFQDRFCEWCYRKIPMERLKAKFCGDPCRNVARLHAKKVKK